MDVAKREDQFLDAISDLVLERDLLLAELEQYRTLVTVGSSSPANVK